MTIILVGAGFYFVERGNEFMIFYTIDEDATEMGSSIAETARINW